MDRSHQRLLRAKISLALLEELLLEELLEELGRRPTDDELQRFLRVLLKATTSYTIDPHQHHGGTP